MRRNAPLFGSCCAHQRCGVPYYPCYYLDAIDRLASVDVIQYDTDVDAKARANLLLLASAHFGVEIWDRSRMVYRVRKTDKPSQS
jgi:hypothetical protein